MVDARVHRVEHEQPAHEPERARVGREGDSTVRVGKACASVLRPQEEAEAEAENDVRDAEADELVLEEPGERGRGGGGGGGKGVHAGESRAAATHWYLPFFAKEEGVK